jgi:lysophospholipase L1-like esterase
MSCVNVDPRQAPETRRAICAPLWGIGCAFAACWLLLFAVQPLRAAKTPPVPWTPTWSTAPMGIDVNFSNQTIRMIVRSTISGDQVRIRLSNRYGTDSLSIGAAHVALSQQGSSIVPGSDRSLNFGGKESIIIPPGGYALSDPVDLKVPQLADVAVTIYMPGSSSRATAHGTGLRTTYISAAGDFTGAADFPSSSTTLSYYWLTDVYVATQKTPRVIVAFGDSITDGARSTPNTGNSWPAILGKTLLTKSKHSDTAVLNEGIGGNRVLHDVTGSNALARFDDDVIEQPGVSTVIILEGINDIGSPDRPNSPYRDQSVTAEDLIQGMQQLINRCHMHNIKIVGATLTPYAGAAYFSTAGESKREALNEWIRTSNAFDAVIDFDRVITDPTQPGHFAPQYDSGDHLHPGDAGYQAMANAAADVIQHMHK